MNTLTPQLLAQIFAQESTDPFLMLLTLTHPDITTIRLVNNTVNITSRSQVFTAFPFTVTLPADDGEVAREVSIEFDNVSLDLIDEIRTVTTPIEVKLEMVLSSLPNAVQISLEELQIQNITYNSSRISARLILDSFLQTEISSERYSPSIFPGIF